MKKYTALLLALLMLLTACGSTQEPIDGQPTGSEATETGTTEATRSDPANTTEVTEPATVAPTTEPTVPATTEPATEATTEPTEPVTTEPATEATTAPTEPVTTEPATEATTAPTEPAATEPTTKPTEPATEPTTAPTEPPTTPPTEPTPNQVTLKLDTDYIEMIAGETKTLTATYSGTAGSPTWSSSNTSVATVNKNGVVTAKSAGKATITAKYGGKEAKCEITVKAPEVKPSLSVNPSMKTIKVGESFTLTATYSGGSGSPNWSIYSGSDVVSISGSGSSITVKGLKAGTAVINATYGGVTSQCVVTVEANASAVGKLTFNTPDWSEVYVGDTLQLSYSYTGDKSALTFKSVVASILTVNNSGLITGVKAGDGTVSVYHGSTLVGSIDIVVKNKPVEETKPEAERIEAISFTGPYFNGTSGVVGNYMTFITAAINVNGDTQKVVVTSSNASVASVKQSDNGNNRSLVTVSFVGAGSATITITSEDGHASASYTLSVKGGYSSAMGGQLTPEQFVSCANGIMAENGANISTDKGYRVLTLAESELTGSRARSLAEGWVREFYPKGVKYIGLSYQGTDENGNHVFYIHC